MPDPDPADEGPVSPYAARPWLASYPDGVPADYAFPTVPLTRLLDDAVASFPSRTALAFQGARLSYRELKDVVDHLAAGLAGLGVGKGDRVAVVLPNCPQNVITVFAVLRLAAVVVQHNPVATATELQAQLRDSGARVVVCLDRGYETVAQVRAHTAVQHVVVTSIADYLPTRARLAMRLPLRSARRTRATVAAPLPAGAPVLRFLELLRTSAPAAQVPLDPQTDVALLQYTGGTTGVAKGAMLTHANLVANAYMNRLWDVGGRPGQEVVLGVLPLFHVYGLTVCLNATLLLGGTLVLLPRFELAEVLAAIDRWRPTMLPGVPPIFKALADGAPLGGHDLSCLRVCVSGAMKLPVEVQQAFERVSGAVLVEGYGLTETSPSTHCNPIDEHRRAGSIGLPLPGTHCRIVAQDDPDREVPVGEPGELLVRGPQVFAGYWGGEPGDTVLTADGSLRTGDVAVMDERGFFTIVDRMKDLIVTGGFNTYPSEVEEVLRAHPEVQEAVVVGVPDRYRGETVKAFVVRTPGSEVTAEQLLEQCRTRLSAYKVPRAVDFRDELPHSVVGKVLRRLLLDEELRRTEQDAGPPARKSPLPPGRSS